VRQASVICRTADDPLKEGAIKKGCLQEDWVLSVIRASLALSYRLYRIGIHTVQRTAPMIYGLIYPLRLRTGLRLYPRFRSFP